MKRAKRILALAEALLLLPFAVTMLSASSETDVRLHGQEIFSSQLDPVTGMFTSSFSYVLDVENPASFAKDLWVRLTLRDVEPSTLKVVAGELVMSQVRDLGKYVELVVKISAEPGRSSWELSGAPRAFPFEVHEEITVDNGPPNITTVEQYRFLSANVGDTLKWKVAIRNTLFDLEETAKNPPMPLTFVVSLDKEYFDVLTLTPSPNSTTAEGANYWVLFLKGTTEIEVEAKVSKLSEWGVATVTPFIISYSSDQIPTMLQGMRARQKSLNATYQFFEGIWAISNSSAAVLSQVSDYLRAISQGVAATGNASILLGQSLLTASSAVKATAASLGNYSNIVRELQRLATEENINRTVISLRGNISATITFLEATRSTIEEEQQLLLELNQTLVSLLASENDTARVALLTQSINIASQMYQNNQQTLANLNSALVTLRSAERSLGGIDVRLVAEEVSRFVNFYSNFEASISALSSSLFSAGNASLLIGAASLNQSGLLKAMADELSSGVNDTLGQLDEMWETVQDMRRGLYALNKDISDLSAEEQRIDFTSPELLDNGSLLAFDVAVTNETELMSLVPRLDGYFVKYIALPSSSTPRVFMREEGGSWSSVDDLSSIGAWDLNGTTFIPIFSATTGEYLCLGGQREVRVVLPAGSSASVYNGSRTSSLVEQASCSIFQPDVARTIGLITGGGQPPQPPPRTTTLGAEVLVGGLVILVVAFWLLTRRRATAMKEERRKRLEELDSRLKTHSRSAPA